MDAASLEPGDLVEISSGSEFTLSTFDGRTCGNGNANADLHAMIVDIDQPNVWMISIRVYIPSVAMFAWVKKLSLGALHIKCVGVRRG